MKIELYYDKECFFCNSYAKFVKLKQEHDLIILNAREEKEKVSELKAKGFDINKGNIVIIDDKDILQGPDSVIFLNELAQKRIPGLNNSFFRKIVFKVMLSLRNLSVIFKEKM